VEGGKVEKEELVKPKEKSSHLIGTSQWVAKTKKWLQTDN